MSPTWRRWLGRLLLLLAALVFCELLARLVFPQPEVLNFNRIDFSHVDRFSGLDHAARGGEETGPGAPLRPLRNVRILWASDPDGFAFSQGLNLYGFRGPDFSIARPGGRQRVLVLGDSVVEGCGAADDETLPAQLEERLGADRFEVINLGVAGNRLPDYVRLASVAVPLLDPDIVVVVIYFNDLPAKELPADYLSPGFTPERPAWWEPRLAVAIRELLADRPLAPFYARGPYPYFLPVPHPSNPLSKPGRDPEKDARVDPEILAAMKAGRFNPFLSDGARLVERRLRRRKGMAAGVRRYVEALKRTAEAANARLIVAYLPAHVTVSDDYQAAWNRLGKDFRQRTLATQRSRWHQPALAELLDGLQIPFVDTTPALVVREAAGERLFHAFDSHPNAHGYGVAAEELAHEILERDGGGSREGPST